MSNTLISFAIITVFPVLLAAAAISDLFTMKIPNVVSLAIIGAFIIIAPASGLTLQDVGLSVVACIIVFFGCFLLFALNCMGGGDAKILTASALWFGLNNSLMSFLVVVCFIGGLVTLFILIARSQANIAIAIGIPLPASIVSAKKIPYGIAIAIGGFLTFEQAPIYGLAMQAFR